MITCNRCLQFVNPENVEAKGNGEILCQECVLDISNGLFHDRMEDCQCQECQVGFYE